MKKVLIAEDDIFLNKVYKVKLKSNNYETVNVLRGDLVIDEVTSSKPDLILLDVIMPGKDGFAVLKELKESSSTRNIPVIILTNLSEESDKNTLLGLGAKKFLTKVDVSIADVVEVIRQELG
jgi:DNA-binding response OmpR family regulator